MQALLRSNLDHLCVLVANKRTASRRLKYYSGEKKPLEERLFVFCHVMTLCLLQDGLIYLNAFCTESLTGSLHIDQRVYPYYAILYNCWAWVNEVIVRNEENLCRKG